MPWAWATRRQVSAHLHSQPSIPPLRTTVPGRTIQATGFMEEAYHQLRSRYPYWDRKGGRDHIIVRAGEGED